MGNSVHGSGKAAFMAANIARYGYKPPEKKVKVNSTYRPRRKATSFSDDGQSHGLTEKVEVLEKLIAKQPYPVSAEEFKSELEVALKVIEEHGENGILNDEEGFFTYGMRRELLLMRGTRHSLTESGVNVLEYVTDITFMDDHWWFSIECDVTDKSLPVPNLLSVFPNEGLSADRTIKVWVPFGQLDKEGYGRIIGYHKWAHLGTPHAIVMKNKETPQIVTDFLNIHYLVGVNGGQTYVRLHPHFSPPLTVREKKEKVDIEKTQLLNSLWK